MKTPEKRNITLSGKVIEVYKKSSRFYAKILVSPNPSDMILKVRKKMNLGDEFKINSEIVVKKLECEG